MKIFKPRFLLLAVISLSCGGTPETLDTKDYIRWVSSVDKGYLKQRKVNAVVMTARYMPAALLAYREFSSENNPGKSYDSIYNAYRCGLTFQFSLHADKLDKRYGNLKYYDVASEEELMGRTRFLNFSSVDFFSIEWNQHTYSPVLCVFEGFDDLDNTLNFTLVFQVPESDCGNPPDSFDNVDLKFDDPLWGLGINHFVFQRKVFESKPKLKL